MEAARGTGLAFSQSGAHGTQRGELRPAVARAGPRQPRLERPAPATAALPGAGGPQWRRARHPGVPDRLSHRARGHRPAHRAARALRARPQLALLPCGAQRARPPRSGPCTHARRHFPDQHRALPGRRTRRGAVPRGLLDRDDLCGDHVLEPGLPHGDGGGDGQLRCDPRAAARGDPERAVRAPERRDDRRVQPDHPQHRRRARGHPGARAP